MKSPIDPTTRSGPRRQTYWDWRAAGNFIGGGSGGGLLFLGALAAAAGADFRPLALLGLCLIGGGLFCVWLEIGKPWRALNVFRHLATSWMTREASVAPLVMLAGTVCLFAPHPLAIAAAGMLGLAFVYSQGRILAADKGIPAWRHPLCLPLVVATGLVEGMGLLALAAASPFVGVDGGVWPALALAGLALVRAALWRRYRKGLEAARAPAGTRKELAAVDRRFLILGLWVPLATAVAAALVPGTTLWAAAGGACATAAGWLLKYTLVRRAAFTQGFSLPHLPVRGRPRTAH